MLTITYDELKAAVIPLAGQPIGKSPDAALIRVYAGLHLPRIHRKEAWPESCMDFAEVTLTDGEFTFDEETQGELLSLYALGNPQTTTIVERLHDWSENDGVIRVTVPALSSDGSANNGTLYAEFQTPPATLPAYGDDDLGETELPARYEFPLAAMIAAEILAKEDPAEAARLRKEATVELEEQASRIKRPWWRG